MPSLQNCRLKKKSLATTLFKKSHSYNNKNSNVVPSGLFYQTLNFTVFNKILIIPISKKTMMNWDDKS